MLLTSSATFELLAADTKSIVSLLPIFFTAKVSPGQVGAVLGGYATARVATVNRWSFVEIRLDQGHNGQFQQKELDARE